jgi:hypothetical protein
MIDRIVRVGPARDPLFFITCGMQEFAARRTWPGMTNRDNGNLTL